MANKEKPPWLHYSVIECYEKENIQIYFDYFFNLALIGGIFWFFHSMILFAIIGIIYSLYFIKEKLKIIAKNKWEIKLIQGKIINKEMDLVDAQIKQLDPHFFEE